MIDIVIKVSTYYTHISTKYNSKNTFCIEVYQVRHNALFPINFPKRVISGNIRLNQATYQN